MSDKLTPNQAKRELCIQCVGKTQFNTEEISNCGGDKAGTGYCLLYPYRLGGRISVKTFRKFCLQCMGSARDGVEECTTKDCPAYPYRFGKNPACAGKDRKASTEVLRKYREKVAGQ